MCIKEFKFGISRKEPKTNQISCFFGILKSFPKVTSIEMSVHITFQQFQAIGMKAIALSV